MKALKQLKGYFLRRLLVTSLLGVLLGVGVLLLVPYAREVFDIALIVMGLLTVLGNLPALVMSVALIKQRGEWINLTVSALSVVFGLLLILMRREVILLLIGVCSILLPLLRIILVQDRRQQFRRELPKILWGLVLVVLSLAEWERITLLVIGIVIIALSLLYALRGAIVLHVRFTPSKGDEAIEADFRDLDGDQRQ